MVPSIKVARDKVSESGNYTPQETQDMEKGVPILAPTPRVNSSKGVYLIILTALLVIHSTSAQDIINDPVSVTVFLGHSAHFKCELDNGFSGWLVNMTPIADLSKISHKNIQLTKNLSSAGTFLELTLLARAEYNGTKIQCVVITLNGSEALSTEAILTVQGQLSAVTNLSSSYSFLLNLFMLISWTAPFSLNVTGVDPDIWYSVNITITKNQDIINPPLTLNITETNYTFDRHDISVCYQYNIFVTPVNGVGPGESSLIEVTDLKFTRRCIKARGDGMCNVSYAITGDLVAAKGIFLKFADGIMASGILSDDEVTFVLPVNTRYESPTFKVIFSCGLVEIPADPFTTFDIQLAQAIPIGKGVVNLTGTFINESLAAGCFVDVQPNTFSPDTFFALKKDKNTQFVSDLVTLPSNTYNVYVYDLEEDGFPYQYPIGLPENIAVDGMFGVSTDAILENASISLNNHSSVVVSCDAGEEDSCVLVYRDRQSPELHVLLISSQITITVDEYSVYTFALFRKSKEGIDKTPFIQRFIARLVLPTPTPRNGQQKGGASTLVCVGLTLIHSLFAFGLITLV